MILAIIGVVVFIAIVYALIHSDKCRCGGTIRWTGYGNKYSCESCGRIIK